MGMWYILRGDKQVGPGTDEQIINLIAKGKLANNTLLKSAESGETKAASQWDVFEKQFSNSHNLDINTFIDNSNASVAPESKPKISKQTKKTETLGTDEIDYSNEPDYADFIKKRQLFLILSIVEFLCCFVNPKFAIGDISGAIIRMLLYIPLSFLCLASFIIKILELIKLSKMTDNQFYINFKLNKKLFNL